MHLHLWIVRRSSLVNLASLCHHRRSHSNREKVSHSQETTSSPWFSALSAHRLRRTRVMLQIRKPWNTSILSQKPTDLIWV
jgi:hypothetical protein